MRKFYPTAVRKKKMKQKLSRNQYLYKRLGFGEVKNPQYFFNLWARWNLIRLLGKISSNRENLIKLFDFRIMGSLISRDLRSSKTNGSSILNGFLLLILSVFIYRSNDKAIIGKKDLNLVEIVHGRVNHYKYKGNVSPGETFGFSNRNLRIFPHHSPSFGESKKNLLNLKRKRGENFSVAEQNLKKKLCVTSVYDQIRFWGSQWWKNWIVEQILPSWKISQSSINEISILLTEKNIEDLKHFFEFCIGSITRQNNDWEYQFDSIFLNDSKEKIESKSEEQIKILEDISFLRIMSAFCEKMIFEAEGPSGAIKSNSKIGFNSSNSNSGNNNNNNDYSFYIFSFHHHGREITRKPYSLRKKLFRNLINRGESNKIIAKFYIFIKKKGWLFFKNYTEFYTWRFYKYKNDLLDWEKDLHRFDAARNKSNTRSFQLNHSNNEQPLVEVHGILSENISYQISKSILCDIKKSNKLKKIDDGSINHSGETNSSKFNETFFEWLPFRGIKPNDGSIKQLTNNSIIWGIPLPIISGGKSIKSRIFSKFFFRNNAIFWIEKVFVRDMKSIINEIFFLENKMKIDYFPEAIYHTFLDILPIDKLYAGFYITKGDIKKCQVANNEIVSGYSTKSDSHRLLDLWKTKTGRKNLLFHSGISLDYPYEVIRRNKYDRNKAKSDLSIDLSPSNISYSFLPSSFRYYYGGNNNKYSEKHIFRFLNYIKLVSSLDRSNLFITRSNPIYNNPVYNKGMNHSINYQFQYLYEPNKNILFSHKFSEKNEINSHFLFILLETLNTTGMNLLFSHRTRKKDLVQNNYGKGYLSFKFFIDLRSRIRNRHELIYDRIYKYLDEPTNNLHLMNKSLSYLTGKNKNFPKNMNNINKNRINKNLLIWGKNGRSSSYYNDIKGGKYIDWDFNTHKWTDRIKRWEKLSKYFVSRHKYFVIASDEIFFSTNPNLIVGWSKRLNKINILTFYRNITMSLSGIFSNHFRKLPDSFKICPNYLINAFPREKDLNRNTFSKKENFGTNNKSITLFYFDEEPIINCIIDYFRRGGNNKNDIELFNNTFLFTSYENKEKSFHSIKVSNRNSLKSHFDEADTLKFAKNLHYSHLNCEKRLPFYIVRGSTENDNLIYGQFLGTSPISRKGNKSPINRRKSFSKEPDIDSIIESQISDILLPEYLRKRSNQGFLFFYNFNKLLELFIRNSLLRGYSISTSFKNRSSVKQVVNFGITNYCESNYCEFPCLEISKIKESDPYIGEVPKPNSRFIQTRFFKNDLLSDIFVEIHNQNNEVLNWINRLLARSNSEISSMYEILNGNINETSTDFYKENGTIVPFLSVNPTKLIRETKIYKILETSSFFRKWNSFEKYIPWLFTIEWWKYSINIVLDLLPEILLSISDQLNSILYATLRNIQKISYNLWAFPSPILETTFFDNFFGKWHLRLSRQVRDQQETRGFRWSRLNLINDWDGHYLTIIGLFTFGYFILQKYFSTLLGSDYIGLWEQFKIIQYLMDPLRRIYVDGLIRRNSIRPIKAENSSMYFLKNLKHYIKNGKFYLFTKQKLNRCLIKNKGLDLSRRERKLLVQSLVTEKNIYRYELNLTFSDNSTNPRVGHQITKKQGFSYLKKLAENYQKSLAEFSFYQNDSAEKWISMALWQKVTLSQILWQAGTSKLTFHRKPVPLQLRLSPPRGILLIGSLETGRSYLIKNIAADSFVPLIRISINRLLYNKPDVMTESWMNILMESLRRLSLILELAGRMSPSIIWIQDIHKLNVNRLTQNVESDPTFLLGILLKYFQTGFADRRAKSLVLFGSTDAPKKVDPALISPDRLDRLINIRMLGISQRQEEFLILLRSKSLYLRNKKYCLNEFGYRTMGYNARDLAALFNEILLISITRNKPIIDTDTTRFAFHRQASGFTHMDSGMRLTKNYGILFYKVGKAIIQNILIRDFPKNPLYISNDLWKKKFYYLSKWYLEPSVTESTIKEFTVLPHVLGCLAGLAARDSWFVSENKPDNLISLDKYAENDFYLACGIMESLPIEFPWLEISQEKGIDKKMELTFRSRMKKPLHMIRRGLFSIANRGIVHTRNELSIYEQTIHYREKLYQLTSNTVWAPRILRLSFIRGNLFDWVGRPNEFEVAYNPQSPRGRKNDNQKNSYFCRIVRHKTKEQLPYERILSRIRRRNVQELESQLEDILSEEQFVILGFSRSSTEYRMEYQLSNKPMLFIGGRFLWDPTDSLFQTYHSIFSRQELFVDEEILRRLYVTYGARREREKSRSSQKIKQFFLRRGYGRDPMTNLSINWWNQLPLIEKKNIETFKRIEGIGVRLKRPQVFTPVYLYQRWLIENPREKLTRFELLDNQQRWLKANSLLLNDFSTYNILLESYHHLFNLFLSNKSLLNEMIEVLLINGWLFQNEIGHFINITNK
uniref:Protein Ycf2 n=1 Tax=Flatbergium sericeum TaxID=128237 RepID=A0A172N8E8_9BRYO|nr:hypothetical protein RF2 [Flatbergium sericeum]